ncbi:MAG: ComEA family DNA-binding protein [Phycisphaerales bacterium]
MIATIGIARTLLGPSFRPVFSASTPSTTVAGADESEAPRDAPAAKVPPPTIAALIDLNSANQAELESLPGIGPALATRIMEDRRINGAYRTVEQLDRVRGIGPKMMEKLRPLVRVVPLAANPAPPG